MVNPHLDLEKELAADYQVYGIAGAHKEIGERLGALYGTFGPTPEEMGPELVDFARQCRAEVAQVYGPLVDEIGAQAKGAGKGMDDMLWHFCPGADLLPGNCSTVGVISADGPVIARNYDYFYFESFRHLVTTYAGSGQAHTGMWTGLAGGRYDGVNAQGVWVSIHGGGGRAPEESRPGVAFHLLCRIVLETCATAGEAVDLLQRVPHIASYNYFVADGEDMFVVEAHPERVRVREPESGVLVCTNHPVHADMVDLTASTILDNSRRRKEFLRAGGIGAILTTSSATDVIQPLGRLMRDHTVPVCGHTDGLATFWSALCIPGEKQLAYSLGAPCRNKYVHANWP